MPLSISRSVCYTVTLMRRTAWILAWIFLALFSTRQSLVIGTWQEDGETMTREFREPVEGPYSNDNDEVHHLSDDPEEAWAHYKRKHGKTYLEEEERQKSLVFREHWDYVRMHMRRHSQGETNFTVALNVYADLTQEEFTVRSGDRRPIPLGNLGPLANPVPLAKLAPIKFYKFPPYRMYVSHLNTSQLPESVDWRAEGYVTPVKNQLLCGACWAFSVIGALEGQTFKYTNRLVSLSEQELIDCTISYGNEGCEGGSAVWAYDYLADSDGVYPASTYPYSGVTGNCRNSSSTGLIDVAVNDSILVPVGNETALRHAVATIGPIAASIDTSQISLKLYKGGIYYDPKCRTSHDHAVLIVGYGTENGSDYWIVKNSWGPHWGVNGYLYLARNQKNHCGIASIATFPRLRQQETYNNTSNDLF